MTTAQFISLWYVTLVVAFLVLLEYDSTPVIAVIVCAFGALLMLFFRKNAQYNRTGVTLGAFIPTGILVVALVVSALLFSPNVDEASSSPELLDSVLVSDARLETADNGRIKLTGRLTNNSTAVIRGVRMRILVLTTQDQDNHLFNGAQPLDPGELFGEPGRPARESHASSALSDPDNTLIDTVPLTWGDYPGIGPGLTESFTLVSEPVSLLLPSPQSLAKASRKWFWVIEVVSVHTRSLTSY